MRECLFEIEGRVKRGKQIGRKLGFPTLNIAYRGELPDGRALPAVLNQGKHPTFAAGTPTVELHLLDFAEELYGLDISVRYLKYLRPERAFASPEALREQIQRDIEAARRYFAENPLS